MKRNNMLFGMELGAAAGMDDGGTSGGATPGASRVVGRGRRVRMAFLFR